MNPLRAATGLPRAGRISILVGVLVLVGAASAPAGADDSKTTKPKASSLAPHQTQRRVYGAPVQAPILHKRHKQGASTSKASTAKTGGHTATSVPAK